MCHTPRRRLALVISRGFTLVELLVVVSIIAVLIGVLLPALGGARGAAVVTKEIARGRDMGTAYLMFALDHQGYVLPAEVELSRRFPKAVRTTPRDLFGRPITGQPALRWFWRLAPYLDTNPGAFFRDPGVRATVEDAEEGFEYYRYTLYTGFGINDVFVGGQKEYYAPLLDGSPTRTVRFFGDRFWVKRMSDVPRPSGLMSMVSSGFDGEPGTGVIDGYYRVKAPYFSELQAGGVWSSLVPPDDSTLPGSTGNVRAVNGTTVAAVFLDGHAEGIEWERLTRDMRLWAPRAGSEDYRVELLPR